MQFTIKSDTRGLDVELDPAARIPWTQHDIANSRGRKYRFGAGNERNFYDFNAMRNVRCPGPAVWIPEYAEKPGGIGQNGTSLPIPALANADHALTGRRIGRLPPARETEFA